MEQQTYSVFKKTCIAGEGFGLRVEEQAANAQRQSPKWWIIFKRRETREEKALKPSASPWAALVSGIQLFPVCIQQTFIFPDFFKIFLFRFGC